MGNPARYPAPDLAYGEREEDTMVKLMLLLYRRPDLSPDDFRRYLQESHMPLVARLPGLRRRWSTCPWRAPPAPLAPPASRRGATVGETGSTASRACRRAGLP